MSDHCKTSAIRSAKCQPKLSAQVAPLINVCAKEMKEKCSLPCPCRSLNGPLVRFYSPISGKIYVRTFSAGGARIPLKFESDNNIPSSSTELKDLLHVRRPRTPIRHLPLLQLPAAEGKLKRQQEFYEKYNSNEQKHRHITLKEKEVYCSKKEESVRERKEDGGREGERVNETERTHSLVYESLPSVYNKYRTHLVEGAELHENNVQETHSPSPHSVPSVKKSQAQVMGKYKPSLNAANYKLNSWRQRIRAQSLPPGCDKEGYNEILQLNTHKQKHEEFVEMKTNKFQNLSMERLPSLELPALKNKPTEDPNITTLLWQKGDSEESANEEDASDMFSRHRLPNITSFPSKKCPISNSAMDSKLPSIYSPPEELQQKPPEQSRKAALDMRKENSHTQSLRLVEINRVRKRNLARSSENEDDPAVQIKKAIRKMKSTSWIESTQGLEEIVQLSQVAPQLLEPHMNTVYRYLIQLLRSLRSTVVRVACNVVRELFRTMKSTMRPEFDEISGILVYKTADTNRFIREDANCALDEMVTHIPPLNTVRVIVDKGANHKNGLVRTAVARLLTCVVALTGPENILGAKGPRETRKRILQTTGQFLDDCNLETRDFARKLYCQLLEYEDFETCFHNDVDNAVLRRIEKTMIKLKYDNESAMFEDA